LALRRPGRACFARKIIFQPSVIYLLFQQTTTSIQRICFSAAYPTEADADRLRALVSSACGKRLQPGSMLSPIADAGKKPTKEVARKPARSAGRRKIGLGC